MKLDVIELLNKMKITIYELLGLIKDGKAPKKVKYGSTTYVYTYKGGISEAYDYIDDEGNYLFERLTKYNYLTNMLTNEVEIIEEDKEIEELNISERRKRIDCYPLTVEIMAKINELIKEVNKIKKG